jgi:hypothetical protein
MIKRKAENQIGNLTPDHKPLENRGQMNSNWKDFLKAIKYFPYIFKKRLDLIKI